MLLHRIAVTGFWQSHATQGGDARGGTRGGKRLALHWAAVRRRTRRNGTIGREAGRAAGRAQFLRAQHLAPRNRPQHTLFANAAYTAVISTLYLAESSSGSLNEGYDISAGYNWTSRRGFGAGIVYSGGFISAERNGIRRTSRIHSSHRSSSPGSGPGADGSSGKARASATAATSAATAIRRAAGAASASMNRPPWSSCWDATSAWGAGISGQWLIVDSPDVDDGAELNLLGGIFRFQFGGRAAGLFLTPPRTMPVPGRKGAIIAGFFHVVFLRHKQKQLG